MNGAWDDAVRLAVHAALVAAVVTGVATWIARRRGLLDVPNERSSHSVPTPRLGGIGLSCGLVSTVLLSPGGRAEAFVPLVLACGLGLWDDRRALAPLAKLLGLAAVAAIPVAYDFAHLRGVSGVPFAGSVGFSWLAVPLALFWLSCYPNAFNFMDGLNGIAALTAAVSGAAFAAAGVEHGDPLLVGWGASASGAALGFLPWNFPRAWTFMGDGGSLPLGLLLAMCTVEAERSRALAFPASVLLLGPFLFDVTFTLVRRKIEGKVIGAAHREHLYQRLSRVWGSHAKVSLLYAGFSVVTGVLALRYAGLSDTGRLLSLVLPLAAMLGFAAFVLRAEREKGS